jgi:preprotein translocase subunit YajC
LAEAAHEPAPPGFGSMLPGLMIVFVLFYFLIIRPQRSKEQEHTSMLDNLKEKDHVVTSGGIFGVVTNVQRDAEVVTLRIDESTGTKIRIGIKSIARVVSDEDKNGKGDKK